jgi:uncharacterized coiled-coil protein SlyX
MFNKKLEKRIEKLEVVIAWLDVEKDKLKEEIKKLNEDLVKAKKPMYLVEEKLSAFPRYGYDSGRDGYTYKLDREIKDIPITDVIKLILDKMNLEVKSVPARPARQEKFVLGKKEDKNAN